MHFTEIPLQGITVELYEAPAMAAEADVTVERCAATVRLDRQGERVLCQGRVEAVVLLTCDRCLAAFGHRLQTSFRLLLEVAPEPGGGEREHVCSRSEMDVVLQSEPEVDVEDLVRQQILLVLPVKRLCRPDCRGLCPLCGMDRNRGGCDCRPEGDSPFAVLAALKKQ